LVLFVTGIVYIAFHFGWGKQIKKEYEKEQKSREEADSQRRNPIR
jgi:hypothetical protein